jgi:hypothetical protein
MTLLDDTEEIRSLLTDQLESVLDTYFPGWVLGRGGRSAYPIPGEGHDLGSFEVYLSPSGKDKRGDWFRRSENVGGNPINLIAYAISGNPKSYREAFREARRFLGMEREPKVEHAKLMLSHLAKAQRDAEKIKRSAEFRERAAREIWDAAKPISNTAAELYLKGRGINFDLSRFADLRFADLLYPYREASQPAVRYPTLVAAVRNVEGEITAIWRIYLGSLNGRVTKAPVPKPKLGLGSAMGGAVWLGGVDETVNITEGIETGLAVVGLTGGQAVAACLSTAGMRSFCPPPTVKRLMIWPDGDRPRIQLRRDIKTVRPSPGAEAALALVERMKGKVDVIVQKTPQNGKDWLDYWNDAVATSSKFGSDEAN